MDRPLCECHEKPMYKNGTDGTFRCSVKKMEYGYTQAARERDATRKRNRRATDAVWAERELEANRARHARLWASDPVFRMKTAQRRRRWGAQKRKELRLAEDQAA